MGKSKAFGVSDYNNFSVVSSDVAKLNTAISQSWKDINQFQKKLGSDAIFMGPVADSCKDEFSKLDGLNSTIQQKFNDICKVLNMSLEHYQAVDMEGKQQYLDAGELNNYNVSGKINLDGNVVVVDKPVANGNKYNLSDDDLVWLGNVALHEQGSLEGAKMELSLMANLYEQHKNEGYSNVRDYVENSGWFSRSAMTGEFPGDEYVSAANDVLNNGNLYLTPDINEHNSMRSVDHITTGDSSNRDDYIPGETIVYNKMGAVFRFEGFAPYDGDPFGVEISDQL